jgi:hypothetical protein
MTMSDAPFLSLAAEGRISRKKERAFAMSLPALAMGRDAFEVDFAEKILVTSLSAQEAVFWLAAKVTIGSKLTILLEVPQTSLLEQPLRIRLAGTVQYVRADLSVSEKDQLVSARLDPCFRIETRSDN